MDERKGPIANVHRVVPWSLEEFRVSGRRLRVGHCPAEELTARPASDEAMVGSRLAPPTPRHLASQ